MTNGRGASLESELIIENTAAVPLKVALLWGAVVIC